MTMNEYLEVCLKLDLNLMPCERNQYKLLKTKIEKGTDFVITKNNYEAKAKGYLHRTIKLQDDLNIYSLYNVSELLIENNGLEMFDHYEIFVKAKGKVLVAGLGIGFIAQLLCGKENVKNIDVVEISKEVIGMCSLSNNKINFIHADFFEYIRQTDLSGYDFIYIDAYSTGDKIYPEIIIPTRNYLLENYPTIPFTFWNEDQFKVEYLLKNRT